MTSTRHIAYRRLCACLMAVFMLMIDVTIVNVALPSIADDIGADASAQALIVSSYTLAFACTLLTGAWLGGLVGRRTVFVCGMAGFVAASILCGLAGSPELLVAARVIQGIAGGLVSGQTVAVIASSFPRERHSVVFAMYGATAGGAAVLGPSIGGVLVSLDLLQWGWRTVFFVNAPIGLTALALAALSLSDARPATLPRLDLRGVVLSTLGLVLLVYPLTHSYRHGWSLPTVLSVVASMAFCALFVVHEKRWSRMDHEPMLRLELFRRRTFAIGCALSILMFGSFTGFFFTVSLSLQFGLELSPVRTGVVTVPFALGAAVFSVLSPKLFARIGTRMLPLGFVLFGVSLLCFAALSYHESTAKSVAALALPLFVGGAGIGVFVAPLQTTIVSGTDSSTVGSASGIIPTVQQVGQAVGLALVGLLFFHQLSDLTPSVPPDSVGWASAQPYVVAQRHVFFVLTAVVAASALLALALPKKVESPPAVPVSA
ncbi:MULTISPECIES: DHA2 family efflux MFS transporter permease subunit [unclassified Rhodococcus (in: high G+C Gram-positive bacteria)]|uniref:DHA2 family efflux MFS transporter permease subunit n=1 Tax=unclassified Rhodococcus (in: high G+C Gram-positive bacteria) TaxID=192944 RepID=UPI0027DF0A75|nr:MULTISPECIES: DHA2 family efflux MFS transporter permease subunit [unclassified Rhodococcus (in: high G+C Gram-positive bacteria)]